jgi:hypothetical protein
MGSTPSFNSPAAKLNAGVNWGEACQLMLQGKRVRRTAWPSPGEYLFLRADVLHIKNAEGEHKAIINSGDLAAGDWVEYATVQ